MTKTDYLAECRAELRELVAEEEKQYVACRLCGDKVPAPILNGVCDQCHEQARAEWERKTAEPWTEEQLKARATAWENRKNRRG